MMTIPEILQKSLADSKMSNHGINMVELWEGSPDFVKWIDTEWQEVEID